MSISSFISAWVVLISFCWSKNYVFQIVSFQDQVIMYTSNGSTGKDMLIQKLERELTDAQQCVSVFQYHKSSN